jgi:hypothetical protein
VKISPYLIPGSEDFIAKSKAPISCDLPKLVSGNMARDDGGLILDNDQRNLIVASYPEARRIIRPLIGTAEVKQGSHRWCLWIDDTCLELARTIPQACERIDNVRKFRESSKAHTTRGYAKIAHKFAQRCHQETNSIVVPKNTVEGLRFLTPVYVDENTITTDLAFVSYTKETWPLAVIASSLHRVWAEAVSGGLGSGIRYSSLITYNSFPLPQLTDKNKADLSHCAEDILLAREAHFPMTIAELYNQDNMPIDLYESHERNDEVIERIFIGRRFRNDTERLEKLFFLYAKMSAVSASGKMKKAD